MQVKSILFEWSMWYFWQACYQSFYSHMVHTLNHVQSKHVVLIPSRCNNSELYIHAATLLPTLGHLPPSTSPASCINI